MTTHDVRSGLASLRSSRPADRRPTRLQGGRREHHATSRGPGNARRTASGLRSRSWLSAHLAATTATPTSPATSRPGTGRSRSSWPTSARSPRSACSSSGTSMRRQLTSSGDVLWGLLVAGTSTAVVGWFLVGGVAVAFAEGGTNLATVPHPVVYMASEMSNLIAVCASAFFVGCRGAGPRGPRPGSLGDCGSSPTSRACAACSPPSSSRSSCSGCGPSRSASGPSRPRPTTSSPGGTRSPHPCPVALSVTPDGLPLQRVVGRRACSDPVPGYVRGAERPVVGRAP